MNDTTTWQEHDTATGVAEFRSTSTTNLQAHHAYNWLPTRLPQLAMVAILAFTTPISFYDPVGDLRRSGASTRLVEMRPRRRRFITIAMARQIALQALEDARRERAEERLEEARLNDLRWNDEDFS